MRTANRFGTALAMAVLFAATSGVRTQAADGVAKAPTTLWNFLGIPQGCHKIEDAIINPRGNHPKLERKPALKRIADPANLESPNPAIKAAAKIKADADLAPQKIKAIKYLATVCCGCAKNKDDVKEALLAALDDCTEEVRYEAAIALCQCAGNPCTNCNRAGCCDAKIMNKLVKISEGKDEQGCWLEPSARVRAAAANALGACQRVHRPTAAGEGPKTGEAPPKPEPAPVPGGEKAPVPKMIIPEPKDPAGSSTGGDQDVNPAGYIEVSDAKAGAKRVEPSQLRPSPSATGEVRFQGRIVPSSNPRQ